MRPRPTRVEVALIRIVLRSWPRAAREEDGEAVVETFVEKRAQRPPAARSGTMVDTLFECVNLFWIGIRLRAPSGRTQGRNATSAGRAITGAPAGRRAAVRGLLSTVRFGVRGLSRRPLWCTMIVSILATGIGSTVAVFSIVDGVAIRRLPYATPRELLRIGGMRQGRPGLSTLSGPNFRDLEAAVTQVVAIAASTPSAISVAEGEAAGELLRGGYVSGGFFSTLGRPAAVGRTLVSDDDRPAAPLVVVIAHHLWRGRFGGRPIVGETLEIEGKPATIVGVMPADFYPPEGAHLGETELWVPLSHTTLPVRERDLAFLDVIGRIAPGTSLAQLDGELDAIGAGIRERFGLSERAFAGFRTASLESETIGDAGTTLLLLLMAALSLLAVAGANVANLVLLRTVERTNELRIKISLGASRFRVAAEMLAETTALALIAGAFGALGAYGAVGTVTRLAPFDIPRLREVHVDGRILIFALGLSSLVGIVLGLVPVWRALASRSPERPARTIVGTGPRTVPREALVLAQVAMGLMLTVGAGLLMRSLVNMHQVNPGLDTRQLYTVSLRLEGMGGPGSDVTLLDRLLEGASQLPGVTQASVTSGAPFTSGGWTVYIQPEESVLDDQTLARARVGLHQISPGHLSHLGVTLVAGRGFLPSDATNSLPVVIVSESLAREHWSNRGALGQRLVVGGDGTFTPRTIVGVAREPRYRGPRSDGEEHIWLPYAQFPPEGIDVLLTVDRGVEVAAPVRTMIGDLDSRIAIRSIEAAADAMRRYFVEPTFFAILLAVFAAVSLLLSVVGLYGTLAFLVAQRRRELGVRLALGADPRKLVGGVVARGALVTALGVALGLFGARMMTSVLSSFLFGVSSHDFPAWFGACGLFLLAALLASWLPARSAGRTSPVACLQSE